MKWDKAEAYFLQLGSVKKFDLRIKLWLFKIDFMFFMDNQIQQLDNILEAFKVLRRSENLKMIMGCILKVGNCLNAGNKQKGQADGYEIGDIDKCFNIRDSNGRSIMGMICDMLV